MTAPSWFIKTKPVSPAVAAEVLRQWRAMQAAGKA